MLNMWFFPICALFSQVLEEVAAVNVHVQEMGLYFYGIKMLKFRMHFWAFVLVKMEEQYFQKQKWSYLKVENYFYLWISMCRFLIIFL